MARTFIVSGIAGDESGTGRLISFLMQNGKAQFKFLFRPQTWSQFKNSLNKNRIRHRPRAFLDYLFELIRFNFWFTYLSLNSRERVIFFHPQNFGFRQTLQFFARRKKTEIFALDSSFFCVRSYNFIPNETVPCLRCLGGNFAEAHNNNCTPFPHADNMAHTFVRKLKEFAAANKIVFWAQTQKQAELLKTHFHKNAVLGIVGLWTTDFTTKPLLNIHARHTDIDVVFHGNALAAKGFDWLLDVATFCPQHTFLFPFYKPTRIGTTAPNCVFKPMTWESGLQLAVREARLVLVPSLWSAPIEGALVKSITDAKLVAAVQNDSSFITEIPVAVVRRLDPSPQLAAIEITRLLQNNESSAEQDVQTWYAQFSHFKNSFQSRLQKDHL